LSGVGVLARSNVTTAAPTSRPTPGLDHAAQLQLAYNFSRQPTAIITPPDLAMKEIADTCSFWDKSFILPRRADPADFRLADSIRTDEPVQLGRSVLRATTTRQLSPTSTPPSHSLTRHHSQRSKSSAGIQADPAPIQAPPESKRQ